MKTCNYFHDIRKIQDLGCQHTSCTNVNATKKDFVECLTDPKTDLKFCYSQLFYHKKPQFIVTTPVMVCPFGINNQGNSFNICLQFTNHTSDPDMDKFYKFIQQCEYKQMELLGLEEGEEDLFISQIRNDKK